jgi:4-hydroxybenzoate polyprenyltransferase
VTPFSSFDFRLETGTRVPWVAAAATHARRSMGELVDAEVGLSSRQCDLTMGDNQDAAVPQTAPAPRRGVVFAWMQLLRVPNLFTVPGDPLAGFLLAGAVVPELRASIWHGLEAAAASLFLYAAGLVHNDLCDLAEDRIERPGRPLPSGRISLRAARTVAWLLMLLGLCFAALACWASLAVAVVLVGTIWVYNRYAKREPVFGPLMMGLCRGLSLLLGVVATKSLDWENAFRQFPIPTESFYFSPGMALITTLHVLEEPVVLAGIVGLTLYIAAVTQIARGETRARSLGLVRFLPAWVLGIWFVFTTCFATDSHLLTSADVDPLSRFGEIIPFKVLAVLATVWAAHCGLQLTGTPEPARVQRTVGMLIRGLLLIQAALAALLPWPGFLVAAVMLACWPLAGIVGKRFYGS